MKALVVTTDKSSRINTENKECIEAFRPCVVTVTEFVQTLVMTGKLKPGPELPDTATDIEFLKFYKASKGDADLATESYLAALNGNPTGETSDDKAAEKAAAAAEAEAVEKAAAAAEAEAVEKAAAAAAAAAAKAGVK